MTAVSQDHEPEVTAAALVTRARELRPELAAPTVRAFPEDGGYRLEGAVAYCSGIPYSTYFMGQAMLPDAGEHGAYNALDEYADWCRDKPTPLPPFGPRAENADFQRWYGAALVKVQTAEAAMLRCAQEHMELCADNVSGERAYTWAQDARLAAIARESPGGTWPPAGSGG